MAEQFLSIGEVCKVLGKSVETLKKWEASKKLVPAKRDGARGDRMYRLSDVIQHRDARLQAAAVVASPNEAPSVVRSEVLAHLRNVIARLSESKDPSELAVMVKASEVVLKHVPATTDIPVLSAIPSWMTETEPEPATESAA